MMAPLAKEQPQTFSLRDVLTILFKHRVKIVASFSIILMVTAVIAATTPSFYVARSVIMIKPGRENVPIGTGDIASDTRLPTVSQESLVNTEMQLIRSNDLIGNVVNQVGMYTLYPELRRSRAKGIPLLEAAVAMFKADLLVNDVKGSNALEILFRHKDPRIAQKGANTLVECLKDKHIQVYSAPKSTFIEDQLKIFREKMNEAGNILEEYKRKNNIVDLKNQYWWLTGKRTDTESQLRLEESKLRELQDRVGFLKNQKRSVASDLYASNTRSKVTELERRETELLTIYKENSRPVANIRKELKTVRDSLARYEEENKQSHEWVAMEAEAGPQQLRINSLRKMVTDLDKELTALSNADKEHQRLEREVEAVQKSYETYLRKYEEMKISEDLDRRRVTNLSVIEFAQLPVNPAKENKNKILGMGLFLAIVVGVGWAYMAEYIPQGMTTPQTAERHLRLAVLVAISKKE